MAAHCESQVCNKSYYVVCRLRDLPGALCLCSKLRVIKVWAICSLCYLHIRLTVCPGSYYFQLQHNQLSTLPEAFGDIASLECVDMSQNDFAEVPACITRLPRLRILYLQSNGCAKLPDNIGDLTRLEHLNASDSAVVLPCYLVAKPLFLKVV